MRDLFQGPGIAIVTRADYDGWPVGMAIAHIGPFETYEDYQQWHKESSKYSYLGGGYHVQWYQLTKPGDE